MSRRLGRSVLVAVATTLVASVVAPGTVVASTDARGGVVVTDAAAGTLAREQPRPRLSPVVGGLLGDGGPAVEALVTPTRTVALTPDGTLLVQEDSTHQVRAVDPRTGVVDVRYGATRLEATDTVELSPDRTWDAAEVLLPRVGQMSVADDGTVWLLGSFLTSIDPAGTVRTHPMPWVPGLQSVRALHVLPDGSVVVAVNDLPGLVGTVGLLPPDWSRSTVPAPLLDQVPTTLASDEQGRIVTSTGAAIHRLGPDGEELVVGGSDEIPQAGSPTDGPAVGAPMRAAAVAVQGETVAYVDRAGFPTVEVALRVVRDGRIVTVADGGDLAPDPVAGRAVGQGVWCELAGLVLAGEDVLVSCGHAVRAFALDGSDRGRRGRVLLGRDLEHRFASPSGTPVSRAGLPDGIHRLVPHPEGLVVLSSVDARQVRSREGIEVVDVIADVRDAAAGLGLDPDQRAALEWRADLLPDGRVVAFVCSGREDPCLLRVQDADGWRTLAGGGTTPVDDGVAALQAQFQPAVSPVLVHPGRGEVVLSVPLERPVPGADRSWAVVAVPLDGGAVRVLAAAGEAGTPALANWLQFENSLLMTDGRVLLLRGSSGAVVLDPAGGEVDGLTTPVRGGAAALAVDGSLWSGGDPYDGGTYISRHDLGTDEHFGGVPADVMVAAGARSAGALLAVPDGVLTAGNRLPGPVHLVDVSPLPPLAPPGAGAVAADRSAVVSWGEADGEGLTVSGYTVTAQPGGRRVDVPGTARSATVTGLSNGTAYRFSVSATNAAGEGPASAPTAPVTPVDTTPPGRVGEVSSTTGWGSAVVRWTPPSDSDFVGVTVVHKPGRAAPTSPTDGRVVYRGSATQATVTGLTQGGYHAVSVFSRDAAGNHGPRAAGVWHGSTVSSTASRRSLTWGQAVVLEAQVRRTDGTRSAGVPVELYVRERGAVTWTRVATATTSGTGTARLSHKPSRQAQYQVRFPGRDAVLGSAGPAHPVDVAMAVSSTLDRTSVTRGTTTGLSGTVSPAHAGRTVHLERLVGTSWRRVTSQPLSGASTYRFAVRRNSAGSETYRVVAPGDADHGTGVSAGRTVRWT